MPRKPRLYSGTGIYHVMLRGINRQNIFEDLEDHASMLMYMQQLIEQYDELGNRLPPLCTIYAYCLMSNHVHILLKVHEKEIGDTIKPLAVSYALYFNRKYSRTGHFFQDRFKSEPVNDITYFVTLLRYIHQNPLKAGIVQHVADYEWSSWKEYIGEVPTPLCLCATRAVCNRIPLEELRDLVETPLADELQCLDVQENVRITIGDQDVRQFLLQEYDIAEPLRVQAFEKELRREIVLACLEQGAGFRQLSRLTGVPYGVIHRIFDRK